MSHNYLTVHTLTSLPFHNVNRDDQGAPKSVTEGGVTRGRISSQSIKREARTRFEGDAAGVVSVRSRDVVRKVVAAVHTIDPDAEDDTVADRARLAVFALTNNAPKAAETAEKKRIAYTEKLNKAQAVLDDETATDAQRKKAEKDRDKAQEDLDGIGEDKNPLVWVSTSEITALAQLIAAGKDPKPEEWISAAFTADGARSNTGRRSTDSLAIAMFGRMFAYAKNVQNEAAVAVSHATTTHRLSVETDYFTTVDDINPDGAGHLGSAQYTSGVYYRRVTFDRQQLLRTWSGLGSESALLDLRLAVRTLIEAVPSGKQSVTNAKTLPALILAEEQAHPVAYSFQTPVTAGESGGFETASIASLISQAAAARAYDPDLFGATLASGVSVADADVAPVGADVTGITAVVDGIIDWLLADD